MVAGATVSYTQAVANAEILQAAIWAAQIERWRRFFEQPNSPRYVMTAQVMPPSGAAS
jgi:hypothetical protein